MPVVAGTEVAVPQLPTTLPTLDELIGRPDLEGVDPVDHLLALTAADPERDHVFTLHAELEGGAYLESFERLLRIWHSRGVRLTDLATYAGTLEVQSSLAATSWRALSRGVPARWPRSRNGSRHESGGGAQRAPRRVGRACGAAHRAAATLALLAACVHYAPQPLPPEHVAQTFSAAQAG